MSANEPIKKPFIASTVLGLSLFAYGVTSCSAPPVAPPKYKVGDQEANPTVQPDDPVDPVDPDDPIVDPDAPDKPTTDPVKPTTPTTDPKPTTPTTPEVPEVKPVVISSEGDGRFEIGPNYSDASEIKSRGAMKGTWKEFDMKGSESVIFKGNYTRKVRVYLPPNFKTSTEYPFMIAMDAQYWTEPLKTTVDNLIADKKIPAMVVLFVDNGGGDSRGSQRGLEYDTVGPNNAKFFDTEVLPRVSKEYSVKFTSNPEGGGLFGGSSSGVAAFTGAWFYPQRFRKVLSYSATFTAQGADNNYPEGGWEYQKHIIKESEVKPIRVCLEAGQNDNKYFNDTLVANENTYKELVAKGYHARMHYGKGAGHVDGGVMRQTIAENMVWLWRDYPKD